MRRLLLLLCALSSLARPVAAEERHVDGIAAQVGGDIVLISEVNSIVAKHEQRMREAGASEEEIAKLRADGLETMIEWRLLEKIVRNAELFATDAEIDRTIAMIAEENGLSVEQLQQSVATQDKGDVFRARARNYPSAREAALFQDDVPVSVYDNLIRTVRANLQPLFRYYALRKQVRDNEPPKVSRPIIKS